MTRKNILTEAIIWTVFLMVTAFSLTSCRTSGKEPAYVEYFKQGDVLYPDYVCPDTLIVNDARGLNKEMALIEQGIIEATDDQIDSVFHLYCSIK